MKWMEIDYDYLRTGTAMLKFLVRFLHGNVTGRMSKNGSSIISSALLFNAQPIGF